MTKDQEGTIYAAYQCLKDALLTASTQEEENITEVLGWLEKEFPSIDFS